MVGQGARRERHDGPGDRHAPAVVLGAILVAALLVPFAAGRPPLAGWGDLFVVIGLLAAARFALALAALDAGSAFGGMGSSRDVAISALAEPGLVLALAGAALAAGSTDLGAIATVRPRARASACSARATCSRRRPSRSSSWPRPATSRSTTPTPTSS